MPLVGALFLVATTSIESGHADDETAQCRREKLRAASKATSLILKAYSKDSVHRDETALSGELERAGAQLLRRYESAEQNQCSVEGDGPDVLTAIQDFGDRLRGPFDVVLNDETVHTILGDVQGQGRIDLLDQQSMSGLITVTLAPGLDAVVTATPDGALQAAANGHVVAINATGSQLTLDGVEVLLDSVASSLADDLAGGQGPAAWSSTSQAWLAFLGVASTAQWRANVRSGGGLGENGNLRAVTLQTICQKSVAVGSAVFVALAKSIGCAGVTASCVGGTLALDGTVLACTTAGLACGVVLAAVDAGLDASVQLKRYLESTLCSTNICQPNVETRACYTDDLSTRGKGACHGGTEVCLVDGKGFGACIGEQTPSEEICNDGIDGNCNGIPDVTDPECTGSPSAISQLTVNAGVAGNAALVLSGNGELVLFETQDRVKSVRTDGSGLHEYPTYPENQPGCGIGCSCSHPTYAPAVDYSGTFVAYDAATTTCGGYFRNILVPDGEQYSSPFGGNTAFASISEDGGRVAYLLGPLWTGSLELWVSDPSGLLFSTRLQSCCGAREPKISGDGQRVAFRSTNNPMQLMIVEVDGGEASTREITPSGANPGRFAISGDGQRVVFESQADLIPGGNIDHSMEIFLWEDGSDFRQLTHTTAGASGPTINADGTKVAFLFAGDIYLFDVNADSAMRVVDIPSEKFASPPSIDATGKLIVFESTADLTGENADGSNEVFAARLP